MHHLFNFRNYIMCSNIIVCFFCLSNNSRLRSEVDLIIIIISFLMNAYHTKLNGGQQGLIFVGVLYLVILLNEIKKDPKFKICSVSIRPKEAKNNEWLGSKWRCSLDLKMANKVSYPFLEIVFLDIYIYI